MEFFLNLLRSVAYGIIEGVTEWLPISSTGHMILGLCFQIFSGKNKFTYLRNILQCVRVCVVVGASCPNGFFV